MVLQSRNRDSIFFQFCIIHSSIKRSNIIFPLFGNRPIKKANIRNRKIFHFSNSVKLHCEKSSVFQFISMHFCAQKIILFSERKVYLPFLPDDLTEFLVNLTLQQYPGSWKEQFSAHYIQIRKEIESTLLYFIVSKVEEIH